MEAESSSLQENMLREQNKDVFKKYEIVEVLGNGSMGAVSKVKIKENKIGGSAFKKGVVKTVFSNFMRKGSSDITDQAERRQVEAVYALKSIILDRISPTFIDELKNEIEILKAMDHPNIVKAHEVFYKKKQIFLVLELCDGGDLYTQAPYSEKRAALITNELLSAINFMHKNAIVHRDLKFENIMFESKSPTASIKVLDFGLSKKFSSGRQAYMNEGVGTIYTMAPQVMQGIYTSKVDLWSVGVISFMLLSSEKPFAAKKRKKMINLILKGEYKMTSPIWEEISEEAKDFVSKLLVVEPKKRLDAPEALDHEWLKADLSDKRPSEVLLKKVDDSLLYYKETSALKKLALNVIAHKSSTDELIKLREVFRTYDQTRDGVVSYEEFKQVMKDSDYSEDTIAEIFDSIDVNQNGKIMYTEFLAATLEAHGYIEEERIAEAFDRIDSDDSGFISRDNLKTLLGKNCSEEAIDEIMEHADLNNDGMISYQEFLKAFRDNTFALAKDTLGMTSFGASSSGLGDSEGNIAE